MSTSPAPAPKFQLPQSPDQRSADKLVKSVITTDKIVIKNDDAYADSWPVIQRHDVAIAKIGEMFDPFVDGLHKMHKMAVQIRANFLTPVMESKKNWLCERVRYSEERARIKAEERRIEAERLQKEQAKQLAADAKKLEKKDPETAEILWDRAYNVPLPSLPLAPAVPKQAGSVVTKRWCFEITEPSQVPREFCDPTPTRIRKYIDAIGESAQIPGVVKWQEKSESSRQVRQ